VASRGHWLCRGAAARELGVGGIDIGVGRQRRDRASQCALDQIATGKRPGVALPGEEDVVGHRRFTIDGVVSAS
jgi:hypothetical protein